MRDISTKTVACSLFLSAIISCGEGLEISTASVDDYPPRTVENECIIDMKAGPYPSRCGDTQPWLQRDEIMWVYVEDERLINPTLEAISFWRKVSGFDIRLSYTGYNKFVVVKYGGDDESTWIGHAYGNFGPGKCQLRSGGTILVHVSLTDETWPWFGELMAHELGHILGFEHDAVGGLMFSMLTGDCQI